MHTTQRMAVALALALLLQGSRAALAGHGGCVTCPQCKHVCKLSVEKDKVDKHCWNIRVEPICIPRIKWPWEKCSTPSKCAKIKYVHKLDKHEYECEKCKYVWTPEPVGPCGGACCGGHSRDGAGEAAPVIMDRDPAVAPKPPAVPPEDMIPQPPPASASRQPASRPARPVNFEPSAAGSRKVLPVFFKTR